MKGKRKGGIDHLVSQLSPPTPDHLVVSREEIVRTEIDSAIRLLFRDRDVISAHLLASAASEILDQIAPSRGKQTSRTEFFAYVGEGLTPTELAEARDFIQLPYNFFKHSSSNANQKIHFRPEYVELTIQMAISDFERVFSYRTQAMLACQTWGMGRRPERIQNGPPELVTLATSLGLANLSFEDALAEGAILIRGLWT